MTLSLLRRTLNITVVFLYVVLQVQLWGMLTPSITSTVIAQSESCSDYPKVTVDVTVPIDGEYKVWVRAKGESGAVTDLQAWAQFGSRGECLALSSTVGEEWTWISTDNSERLIPLSAGNEELRLTVLGQEALWVDKVLLTSDKGCVPINLGSNCATQIIDFEIAGIAEGEIVTGARVVEALISSTVTQAVNVAFYIDDATEPYVASSEAPFCMVQKNRQQCDEWSTTQLPDGAHSIRVVVGDGVGSVSKTLTFTVENVPDPTPTPLPTSAPTPAPTRTPQPTPVSTPRPTSTPMPTPLPTVAPTVLPTLSPTPTPSPSVSPTPTPTLLPEPTVPAVITPSPTPKPPTDVPVVNGEINIALQGTTPLTPTTIVRYVVNGQTVAETRGTDPTVAIDTSQLDNGVQTVTAVIVDENGNTETVSTKITVDNSGFDVFLGWLRSRPIAIVLIGLPLIVLSATGIFIGYKEYNNRRLYETHTAAAYDFVQPALVSPKIKGAVMVSVIQLLLFGGGWFYANVVHDTSAGTAAFVVEVEQGTAELPHVFAIDTTVLPAIGYARMQYAAQIATPSPSPSESSTPVPSITIEPSPELPTPTPTPIDTTTPTPTPTPEQ